MISKEELRSWLEGDTYHPLTHEDERGRKRIFCKLPKNGRFDYLFMPKFLASEITRHTQLECVGIYDREEKIIYDACGYFSAIDPEIEYPKNSNDMQDELTARVQALVEERVDNNPENLEISELSIRGKDKLSTFAEYEAKNEARKAFIEGKTSEGVKYECWYSCNDWNHDEELLSYIANPQGYAKKEAERYYNEHQQDILLTLRKNELLKAELMKFEQQEDSPTHRIRRIIEAAKGTDAKSLTVTADKEEKELTFKIEANALRRDPITFYSSWDMPAKDRRAFEETFGPQSHLYPEDIVDISYCGKSIYSAEPYEEPVETEEMAQTM